MARAISILIGAVMAAGLAAPAHARVTASPERPTCFGVVATIVGTEEDDVLEGTAGNDVIVGGKGDDRIYGREGDDLICPSRNTHGLEVAEGGPGDDKITGDWANLRGDGGDDVIVGGKKAWGGIGADRLVGPNHYEYLSGGPGNDIVKGGFLVRGGAGDDVMRGADYNMYGGPGDDSMRGSRDYQIMSGGSGDDLIVGVDNSCGDVDYECYYVDHLSYRDSQRPVRIDKASGTATGWGNDRFENFGLVYGSDHDDVLIAEKCGSYLLGRGGDDTLLGRAGGDLLGGGAGNDRIVGRGGGDWLAGHSGDDRIVGGTGEEDLAYYGKYAGDDPSGPVQVDLGRGVGLGDGTDELAGIEGVWGTPFADVLTGSDKANYLDGDLGDDALAGAGGDDALAGSDGSDTLEGGADDDTLYLEADGDKAGGGPGSDTISYQGFPLNAEFDGITADLASGTGSRDGEVVDTFTSVESLIGSSYRDKLIGDDGPNRLKGAGRKDYVLGMGGDDLVFGGPGDDTLDGGLGQDRMDGGDHDDVCLGGEETVNCETEDPASRPVSSRSSPSPPFVSQPRANVTRHGTGGARFGPTVSRRPWRRPFARVGGAGDR